MGILFENGPASAASGEWAEEEQQQPEAEGFDDSEVDVPAPDRNRNNKPKRMALLAFVGVFTLVVVASVTYLAIRRISAPASEAAAMVPQSAPRPMEQAPVQPNPEMPGVAAASPVRSAASASPIPAAPSSVQPQDPPAKAVLTPLAEPLPNRFYLQVGSLESGVAEVLTQGLRIKGMSATIAPGVTPLVSRIIVGPFASQKEIDEATKHLTELGFKPFPRRFDEKELRKLFEASAAAPSLASRNPDQPDVRR